MIEADIEWNDKSARVLDDIPDAARKGQLLAGEHILGLSRDRVPIEEGTLERSGQVTTDGKGTVAVAYDTPYAVRQHEDLGLRHDQGRQAKFLETALADGKKDALELIAAQLRQALAG